MQPSKWKPVWVAALLLATALAPASRAAADDEQAKVALNTEEDPFSLDDPRTLYGDRLYPAALSDAGTAFFYPLGGIFSSGTNYIYQGTPGRVLSRTGRDSRATGGETFSKIQQLDVNPAGQMAFTGITGRGREFYLLSGSSLGAIALIGAAAADDGNFQTNSGEVFAGNPAIGSAGHVAFQAKTSGSGQGIFLTKGVGAPIKRIARVNDDSQDGGKFLSFDTDVAVATSPSGKEVVVAFTATTSGTASTGLYLGNPTRVKLIATGSHTDFRLNSLQQVVFEDGSIFRGSFTEAGPATAVVSNGDATTLGGTFTSLRDPMLNDRGQIAFYATGSASNDDGIYLREPSGDIKPVVTSGQAFDGGVLDSIGSPELSNAGLVMFYAVVRRGSTNFPGIFLGNENGLLKVIAVSDPLLDSVVVEEPVFLSSQGPQFSNPGRLPGHGSLNSHGQVAYRAVLNNGTKGVFLFTPALHWAASGDGAWDTAANWTLGLLPSALQNVSIDPTIDLTVTGPAANTKVLSLKVGGNSGIARLHLQPGKVLAAKNGTTVLANGILEGGGTLGGKVALQAGSKVVLTIGGRDRGLGYDFIKATGALRFGGTLDVSLKNGFDPAPGDTFDLFDFPSRTGAFATMNLPALSSPGFQWDTTKLGTSGKLSVALVPALRGSYTGIISAATPALATSGPVAITVKPNGFITAKGRFGSQRFTFSGPLNALGELTGPLYKNGPTLKLTLDLTSSPAQITGTITDAATPVATLTADLAPAYHPRTNPNPFTGTYTIALPPDSSAPSMKTRGLGYATLTVSPKGAVKLLGQLADATPISAGSRVTARGEIPLFLPLYRKTGFLFGRIALHGATSEDAVDGTLKWSRPLLAPGPLADGFDWTLTVEGSGYVAPSFPAGPATLTFANGGIPAVSPKTVTIDAQSKVTVDPLDGVKLKLLARGLFSGRFTITGTDGKPAQFPYKGAVIQKQHAGKGVFLGVGETGSVDLR